MEIFIIIIVCLVVFMHTHVTKIRNKNDGLKTNNAAHKYSKKNLMDAAKDESEMSPERIARRRDLERTAIYWSQQRWDEIEKSNRKRRR